MKEYWLALLQRVVVDIGFGVFDERGGGLRWWRCGLLVEVKDLGRREETV